MILRKPYAFLIKHFRTLHVIMLLLMLYAMFELFSMLGFYNEYIGTAFGSFEFETIAKGFSNFFVILTLLLIIAGASALIYLLHYKKKPLLLYVIIIIFYALALIGFLFSAYYVAGFKFTPPSPVLVRIIRDILFILFLGQVGLAGLVFVRAIGFDIKKFDFRRDVEELGITDEDNAEFEFDINLDARDILAKYKKKLRYASYFYKQYSRIINAILIVVGVVLVYSVATFVTSLEHVYRENEVYDIGSMDCKILKTYRTINNSKGNRINDKYYYVVVKLQTRNKSDSNATLNTNNMKLYYDGVHSVTPKSSLYEYFKEYGTHYYNQILRPGETKEFVIAYEIPIEYYSRRLKLRTMYSAYYGKDGTAEYDYRTVSLNPELDKEETKTVVTKKIGEEITFDGSILGKTTIKITKMDISDTFYYNITNCEESTCRRLKADVKASSKNNISLSVMRLNYTLKYDSTALGSNYNVSDFIARFGRIRYVISGVKDGEPMNHNLVLKDITPLYTNKISFIEVKNILSKAVIIYLDFTIRDKVYTYILKDDISGDDLEDDTSTPSVQTATPTA